MPQLSDVAIRAAKIGGRKPARVALARDARLSSWELIVGGDRTIARIEKLIAEARSPSPRPLLTAQRLPLERCLEIGGGRLLPILENWVQRQGQWEPDLHGRLLEWKLLPVTVITVRASASERLLVHHWGSGVTTYGKDWTSIAPGRDFEDQPHAEMARWRAALLRQVIAEGVPQLTASDAVFRRVDGSLVRLKLRRLTLPWRMSDGAVLTTGIFAERHTMVLERPNPAN